MKRLIAGLGNPGAEYEQTRHNVGFMVAEALAARENATWTFRKKWNVDLAEAGDSLLVKPQTYMNKSGSAVGAVVRYRGLEPADCLIVLDDVDLPFGELRYRESGGSGGHKGLADVLAQLGTEDVPRLRIGVGRGDGDTTDHVLGRFTPEEEDALPGIIDQAVAELEQHE